MDMGWYLKGVLAGSPETRAGHVQRAKAIQAAIGKRFGASHPERWQVKCLRWFLVERTADYAADTRYKYGLTIRLIAIRRGCWANWEPLLQGPWQWPRGQAGRRA